MFKKYKKYWPAALCLALFFLVDLLIAGNIVGKTQKAVFGLKSRRWLVLMLLGVNLLIGAACFLYERLAAARKKTAGTWALALLSPFAGIFTLETMTGNLSSLPKLALVLNLCMAFLLLALSLLFFVSVRRALIFYNIWMPLLGTVQYYVYKFRGRSFMLMDIGSAWTAAQVAGGYSFVMDLTVGAALLAALGWLFLCVCTPDVRLRRYPYLRKAAVVVVCVLGVRLLCTPSFAAEHDTLKMDMWDTEKNYRDKGYLLNLAAQLQYFTHEKPENYSQERVQEIAETYRASYDAAHAGDTPEIEPVNLIVVMNESWADLRIFDGFRCGQEITPYIDAMDENVTKGWLSVPTFGGLTANTEYEVLTGNSMYLAGGNGAVAYQVYHQKTEYAMARTLAAQGWQTLAMHPGSALNFNRRSVYPSMGFASFISRENWDKSYRSMIHKHVTDQSCYEYLEKLYEEKEDGPWFNFLVTIQNHGGYSKKGYESTVELDYEKDYAQAELYLSLIRETDAAFGSLVEYYKNVEEPTMIVMFGDHLPNLQDGFYDMLRKRETGSPQEAARKEYLTPFVIWTNYERKSESDVMMSSNYFGSYLLQLAGARLTDYQKFLLEMKEQMPVIAGGEVMLSNGSWSAADELSGTPAQMYEDYQILQYNNMFGKGKRETAVFAPALKEE